MQLVSDLKKEVITHLCFNLSLDLLSLLAHAVVATVTMVIAVVDGAATDAVAIAIAIAIAKAHFNVPLQALLLPSHHLLLAPLLLQLVEVASPLHLLAPHLGADAVAHLWRILLLVLFLLLLRHVAASILELMLQLLAIHLNDALVEFDFGLQVVDAVLFLIGPIDCEIIVGKIV